MEKKISASQIALWILLILSAVVLVMFFGVGYGKQDTFNGNVYTAPQYTGLLIIWLYALVIICAGVVFAFGIAKLFTKKSKKSARTGLVGPVFLFMFAAVAVSYLISSTEPIRKGDGVLVKNIFELKLSDTCLYSIYALSAVAIIVTLFAMIGVFKAKIKK